jgi:hypothetical protein
MRLWLGSVAILTLGLVGCGSGTGIAVTGTVTLDGEVLPGALVTFRPADQKTEGLGGAGTTGPDGKYTLRDARSGGGLAPGQYKVSISRRLRPDGSVPPPDVPPIESDARETLPPRYSDPQQSSLRANVSKEQTSYDFPLKQKQK